MNIADEDQIDGELLERFRPRGHVRQLFAKHFRYQLFEPFAHVL